MIVRKYLALLITGLGLSIVGYFVGLIQLLNHLELDIVDFLTSDNKLLIITLTFFIFITAILLFLFYEATVSTTKEFMTTLKKSAPDIERMIHACGVRNIIGSTKILKDRRFIKAYFKSSALFFSISAMYFLYLIFFVGEEERIFLIIKVTMVVVALVSLLRDQPLVRLSIYLHIITLYGLYCFFSWDYTSADGPLIIPPIAAYISSLSLTLILTMSLIINQSQKITQFFILLITVLLSYLAFCSTTIKIVLWCMGISFVNNIEVVETNTNKKVMSGTLTLKTSGRIIIKDENLKKYVFSTSQYHTQKAEKLTDPH